jgi:hypothetical protein
MGTVIVREYSRAALSARGQTLDIIGGVVLTDSVGGAIKTASLSAGGNLVEIGPLEGGTHFVEIETDVALRYAVRPKDRTTTLNATSSHRPVAADAVVLEAVHPGAYISFLSE